jgi:alcohol dehydrogenase
MNRFEFQLQPRIVFGNGAFERLGQLAAELGFRRTLLVADRGLLGTGYTKRATDMLAAVGINATTCHDFEADPDSEAVAAGYRFAVTNDPDSVIGLGGGSSLDCAKAINFLLTNGGRIQDYWGFGKAARPMLPMIGVPTTAGTGSEAQSYALISDSESHVKMACGDPKAAFRLAILDPILTITQPKAITAQSGFDALAHAVETFVTTKRTGLSEFFSREAWRLLEGNYELVLAHPEDVEARGAMQLGALLAGIAIENSMLGATHACANPLTARYGTAHGSAIAMLLPSVVRWNGSVAARHYSELLNISDNDSNSVADDPAGRLAQRLEELAAAGGLVGSLGAAGIPADDLPLLAAEAAKQWTGSFNPRPFDIKGAMEVYEQAY